ncbi:GNAT family N-acetyltransferase [Sporosalibacterium faouarense]|uniref:GNAT family N-acetyltransferase n=1 Tax=Sporosalibacterium faouarense TaxID=516123 RepID=UPI00141D268A|nr:GNAT family N-acetyltransferase [Sporosalibacterium faouarense]MTI49857.1 GNAT family N-acetyltransferase [Bacillota bacterium]
MDWQIKHFKELDTMELYKIIKERVDVFVVEQNCPYPECDNKDLESYHIFSIDEGNIVAYARILPKGISYNEVSIGRVLVNQKYRKQGLGKELMENTLRFIKDELNETNIRISAQEYLFKFYCELGFEQVSEIYLEDGIPHLEMIYI